MFFKALEIIILVQEIIVILPIEEVTVRKLSIMPNYSKEIKIGLICNYSGISSLESSAGAISLAIDQLKADGYLSGYKILYAKMI